MEEFLEMAKHEINISVEEEQDKYFSIFNNSHAPMLIIDSKTGSIRDGNFAACKYYGYSVEELRDLNISQINTLAPHEIARQMKMAKDQGRNYFQFRHRLASGEIREVEVYSGPITIEGDTLLFSIIFDIQYKREMEHKIKIQESYFKSLYENSPEGVVILDSEFKVLNINKSFEKIFGYHIDEIKYKNITEILCDETMYDESTYFKDSISRGEFVRRETQRKAKDGRIVDSSFLGYPIVAYGEPLGVYGIYTDLTAAKDEKREQDRKLHMYINTLRSTIDSIPDYISVYTPDYKIALMNKAGCQYFNIEEQRAEGMNWQDVLRSRFSQIECFGEKVIASREVFCEERWLPSTNEYFDWHCAPVLNEEGELMLIVERIRDISETKRHEVELKSARDKAEEASRFKTKFLANVVHEIRTPMNGIIGIVDLLNDTQLTYAQKEYFEMLRYSADRLSIIINDVLDIAKIESGKLEIRNVRFHLKGLLADAEKYFQIQANRKRLELSFIIDSRIPDTLFGDGDKLNQILFNLLSNAIKFTDQGYITLQVNLLNINEASVEIQFSVSDTGIGIPPEHIHYLFDDFFQSDSASTRKYMGAGLGLPISKKLVELMDGFITVESTFGKGSIFAFQIKLACVNDQIEPLAELAAAAESLVEVFPAQNALIIEDESINRNILKDLLDRKNCEATLAANGKDALKILDKKKFDVILMDIFMPEIDGVSLAKMIRQKERAAGGYTPIIAITAAVMSEDKKNYFEAGIDSYIPKPFSKQQLYDEIIKVLNKRNHKVEYDLKPLLDTLDGDYDILSEIISEVTCDTYYDEFIVKMDSYIRDRDFSRLAKQIHKFKGSISHFRLYTFNKILTDLKDHCKHQDLDKVLQLFESLKSEFEQLRKYLKEYNIQLKELD